MPTSRYIAKCRRNRDVHRLGRGPTSNGRGLLLKNLPPLLEALDRARIAWEVIVVDDASTEDTGPLLRERFPGRGWKSVMAPEATVWHSVNSTIRKYHRRRKVKFLIGWIDEMLKNIVADDPVKVPVRQVVDQNVPLSMENYNTRAEARRDLFDYIEVVYNRLRRHSSLGRCISAEFEVMRPVA